MSNNEVVHLDVKIAFKYKKPKESFANKLICWWTKSQYFHVELIIGSKWISSNPDVGGVTINDLQPLKDTYHYLELKDVYVTVDQHNKIMQWISSQQGKKYDWCGIVWSQVFPFNWNSKNKWFCSEIVTTILKFMLVKEVMDSTPNNVSPGDLARKFNFNK